MWTRKLPYLPQDSEKQWPPAIKLAMILNENGLPPVLIVLIEMSIEVSVLKV